MACQVGYLAVVRLLLDGGAAVNQANNEGATPLLMAIQEGNEAIARLLAQHGAIVKQVLTAPNGWQGTSEDLARGHGHPALAKWLRTVQVYCLTFTSSAFVS